MGDPRTLKTKYETPKRIWNEERIAEEHALKTEYGLKNMRELWIAKKMLRKIRRQARKLLSTGEQGQKEADELLRSAIRLGFAKEGTKLGDLLALTTRDILERRLQTRVVKLGLARSMKQARQLIAHGYISVNGSKISAPSYMVPVSEEKAIAYYKPINLETPELKAKEAKKQGSTVEELAPKSPEEV
ncbi:30S ribosomal protein S4 [Candidatus Micrarchaeota archaeon]|nr:MAG: 30S ribosomal protein S4 [Candidatus Micrarchaeota archaeon]